MRHAVMGFVFVMAVWAACEQAPPPTHPSVPPLEGPTSKTLVRSAKLDTGKTREVWVGVHDDVYADTDPSALTDFHATLDPHGTWLRHPTYGTVWVPDPNEVGADFTPYLTRGRWAYEDDYVWLSDYPWGWVPFHYGRWLWVSAHDWLWIPGRAYSTAWVTWRVGDEDNAYVGWAPMPPAWTWWDGQAVGISFVPRVPFVFCTPSDLFERDLANRVVDGLLAAFLASHTPAYVRPEPVGSEDPLAQAFMHGPTPASLGIESERVARVTGGERDLAQARRFARPSSAEKLGAHPPVPHAVRLPAPMVITLPRPSRP